MSSATSCCQQHAPRSSATSQCSCRERSCSRRTPEMFDRLLQNSVQLMAPSPPADPRPSASNNSRSRSRELTVRLRCSMAARTAGPGAGIRVPPQQQNEKRRSRGSPNPDRDSGAHHCDDTNQLLRVVADPAQVYGQVPPSMRMRPALRTGANRRQRILNEIVEIGPRRGRAGPAHGPVASNMKHWSRAQQRSYRFGRKAQGSPRDQGSAHSYAAGQSSTGLVRPNSRSVSHLRRPWLRRSLRRVANRRMPAPAGEIERISHPGYVAARGRIAPPVAGRVGSAALNHGRGLRPCPLCGSRNTAPAGCSPTVAGSAQRIPALIALAGRLVSARCARTGSC